MPDQTNDTAAGVFVSIVMFIFSISETVTSNQGSCFKWKKFCDALDHWRLRTSKYHPLTSAMTNDKGLVE